MRLDDRIHSDDFPASYYAASRRDTGSFDRLDGDITCDVAVLGGGFTGVATTLFLAEKGLDVVLLEQNEIGWGASGRNGGQVIGGFGPVAVGDRDAAVRHFGEEAADRVLDMAVESACTVRNIVHRYNIPCDLKWGYVDVAANRRQMAALAEEQADRIATCYPHHSHLVDQHELPDHIRSPRFVGGLVDMGSGHLHPLDLVRGEARAAQTLGARILEHAEVTSVTSDDKGVTLTADGASVRAGQLVLGANAYLGRLVPRLASRICPVGSYLVATEPMSDAAAREVMPSDFAACDLRTVLDYWRLSADRRLLFGGMANYGGGHPADIERVMRPRMERVFPQTKGLRIDFAWGGNIGITRNRLPQIGTLDDRIFYAQGYSGHGVAASHLMAKLIAGAVTGQASEGFEIMRSAAQPVFPGGPFRQKLLALGMLYYRATDLFK